MSMSLTWQGAVTSMPVALLEGALVMLPSQDALRRLSRMRSPLWTALLPGSIIVGTFGLLLFSWAPTGALLAAAVSTPLLAAAAALFVVRARAFVVPVASAAAMAAVLAGGEVGQLAVSVVMGLGCLTVGVALNRLVPARWLLVGIVVMAVADVALLASSYGYRQTAVLAAASTRFHGPQFTAAIVGGRTIGYPDLWLTALLGACLAGRAAQRQAALILMGLVVVYDSTLQPGELLPATVPIALTLIIVTVLARLAARRRDHPGHPAPTRLIRTSPAAHADCTADNRARSARRDAPIRPRRPPTSRPAGSGATSA